MFSLFKKKPKVLTAERQLQELAWCGIRPRGGLSSKELLKFRAEAYVEKPYLLVMIALGGDTAGMEPMSDGIWHLHPECIARAGDYVRVAERLRLLAGGRLPLQSIEDGIDFQSGTAWLAFELDGRPHRLELRQEGSRLDPALLTSLACLLQDRGGAGHRFTWLKLGGPDALIGCTDEEGLGKLNRTTGLGFTWLE